MKTPAGTECRYYYEDFHRGHSTQECRLIQANPVSPDWRPRDCTNCPVPEILLANGSPHLLLEGIVKSGMLGFNRRVEVTAYCTRHQREIAQPHVGCPICAQERPGLQELFGDSNG